MCAKNKTGDTIFLLEMNYVEKFIWLKIAWETYRFVRFLRYKVFLFQTMLFQPEKKHFQLEFVRLWLSLQLRNWKKFDIFRSNAESCQF